MPVRSPSWETFPRCRTMDALRTIRGSGKLPEPAFHRIAASATLTVSPAGSGPPLHGEVAASYDGVAETIKLGHSWLELPNTRVDVTGVLGQRLDVQFQSKTWPISNPRSPRERCLSRFATGRWHSADL